MRSDMQHAFVKDADLVKRARKLIKVNMLQSDDKQAQEAKQ